MNVDLIMLRKGIGFHKSPQANVLLRLVDCVVVFKPVVHLKVTDRVLTHLFR